MSLLRIPFVVIDAVNMLRNATPPNPPAPICDVIIPDWRERFLRSLVRPSRLLRAMYWTVCFIEVLVIILSRLPKNSISNRVLAILILNGAAPVRIRITPLFICGNLLGFFGTALRVQSFRSLGCLFTFELYIHPNHKLITDGPYSVIRHPSYTGLIMTILGYYCTHSSGSWLKECGLLHTMAGKIALCTWSTIAFSVIVSLLLRVLPEEEILRAKFGDEWETWAARVPYKLVPRVY